MNKLKFLLNYVKYRLKADNEHQIHSPFIFKFYNDAIKDENPYYIFDDIESIRAKLLLFHKRIVINDYGAGSMVNSSNERKISDIAKNTAKSPKYGQLLFRMVNWLKPNSILEFGTSFGLSTMYLAASSKNRKVVTVEGCPNTAKVAQINFDKIGFEHIELINQKFDNFLPEFISSTSQLDFVFFDGNHRKEATLTYFNQCVDRTHNQSVFVFDDIHWSEEMLAAWETIKKHPKVTSTIDLFMLGIVFFNTDLSKEHFVLKF